MIFELVLLTSFLGFCCSFLSSQSSGLKLPPGPKLWLPIIGHSISLGENMVNGFTRTIGKYGNIFTLYIGPIRSVVLADYDLIKEAFSNEELCSRPMPAAMAMKRPGVSQGGSTPGWGVMLDTFCKIYPSPFSTTSAWCFPMAKPGKKCAAFPCLPWRMSVLESPPWKS